MTRAEIIAELRRSATEDAYPYGDVGMAAFWLMRRWVDDERMLSSLATRNDLRTFYLLVAHAMEDEK